MRELLHEIGKVLNQVDNKIALSGHTDAAAYAGGERGYSNWELSADRANASRRELIAGGMQPAKIVRVVGLADSNLLVKDDPRNPLNRRISIIVMNKIAEERLASAGGEIEAGSADEVRESVDAPAAGQAGPAGRAGAGTAAPAAADAQAATAPAAVPARP
jgi:chemotaxis protein MotB